MKMPEAYRRPHPLGLPQGRGTPYGFFVVPHNGTQFAVQASDDGVEWEHVSISIPGEERCPTWAEMCFFKGLFWGPEDCVLQFHPPKSEYVNLSHNCLHLWRFKGPFPRPPRNYVG